LDSKSYDAKVGRSSGPAVAFILYAALGRRMLDLASSPWSFRTLAVHICWVTWGKEMVVEGFINSIVIFYL
jgi:hypothetical protein